MKKYRFLAFLFVAASAFLNSPVLLAAEDEEAGGDPVWVLSYAGFIGFAAVVIFLAIFFSRRRETALSNEELKHASQVRNDRVKERRRQRQYEMIHGKK